MSSATAFPPINKKISAEFADFELLNEIVTITNKPGVRVTLAVAEAIVAWRMEISAGSAYPVLSDARNIRIIDKDARDYLGSLQAGVGVKALALLVGPFYSTFMANFFMRFTLTRPRVPVNLFTDRTEALQWLEQFK